jgi:hypothetical protein
MKRFFSLTAMAFALAFTFAFTTAADDPQWELYDGTIVTGTKASVKSTYCPGPDVRLCAVNVDDPFDIILRP